MFAPNTILTATNGEPIRLSGKRLGEGGQGVVYQGFYANGTPCAVKWYHREEYLDRIDADAFYMNFAQLVKKGPPTSEDGSVVTQFVWPQKLLQHVDGSFGYVMPLFPPDMSLLSGILHGTEHDSKGQKQPVRWMSWFTLITAAINMVRAFEVLHLNGYSYQDINPGSFRFNTKTGEVLICDCDNVAPSSENLGIQGVMPYMAPEVVRGEKLPDTRTDQYSMAIILFRLFFIDHPLRGRATLQLSQSDLSDDAQALQSYGLHPQCCLDSKHHENEADPQVHVDVCKRRKRYPKVLTDAFEETFTVGAQEPAKRMTDSKWRKVLFALRDSLMQINGREQFVQEGMQLPKGCRVLVCHENGREVYVMPNKVLYGYHAKLYGSDYRTGLAKVVAAKTDANLLGLFNGSQQPIHYTLPDGVSGDCLPGKPMALLPGGKLTLGECTYEIK